MEAVLKNCIISEIVELKVQHEGEIDYILLTEEEAVRLYNVLTPESVIQRAGREYTTVDGKCAYVTGIELYGMRFKIEGDE